MSHKHFTGAIICASVLAAVTAGAIYVWFSSAPTEKPASAPIPIPTPEQSATATPAPTPTAPPPSTQKSAQCIAAGCNGEICTDAADPPLASICIYKDEYACYRTGTCAVQSDGNCGWTQTSALKTCIADARCGAPPDQPAPPPGCAYQGIFKCADGQWTKPRLVCASPSPH